ncbi:hypothetical protein [Williamsia sp. Leaf354]|uniref:hypothetical protein n=1 Tax=Williamsia sp. Leaf354 TaxID=1736349 RepID=UPI0012E34F87|nr:hypothetical protein [Williamsia sp. Leaf354]
MIEAEVLRDIRSQSREGSGPGTLSLVSYRGLFDDDEVVMSATWSEADGVVITSSELPETWHRAINRLCRDLNVQSFNGTVGYIAFEAMHDRHNDFVWLSSDITPFGGAPAGAGHSGGGALVYDDEEAIVVSCADLVQDQIARAGIQWPRGHSSGFLRAELVGHTACWVGRDGARTAIGTLRTPT